jgi:hypothetical protein
MGWRSVLDVNCYVLTTTEEDKCKDQDECHVTDQCHGVQSI